MGGKELSPAHSAPEHTARDGPLISAPFCPQPLDLSAGNSSSEMKGKQTGLVCVLTTPSPFTPLQRVGRDWPGGWVQDDIIKLG